jgi:hypothetical protein
VAGELDFCLQKLDAAFPRCPGCVPSSRQCPMCLQRPVPRSETYVIGGLAK